MRDAIDADGEDGAAHAAQAVLEPAHPLDQLVGTALRQGVQLLGHLLGIEALLLEGRHCGEQHAHTEQSGRLTQAAAQLP